MVNVGEVFIGAGKRGRLGYKSKAIYPPLSPADWKTNTGGRKCELMATFSEVQALCYNTVVLCFYSFPDFSQWLLIAVVLSLVCHHCQQEQIRQIRCKLKIICMVKDLHSLSLTH